MLYDITQNRLERQIYNRYRSTQKHSLIIIYRFFIPIEFIAYSLSPKFK